MPSFAFLNDFGIVSYVIYGVVVTVVGLGIYFKVKAWMMAREMEETFNEFKEGQN